MGIFIPKNNSNYLPAPAGSHPAVCIKVVDQGEVLTNYQGKEKKQRKIAFVFAIDKKTAEGHQYHVWVRFTLSLHKRARLTAAMQNWLGREIPDKEKPGFNFEELIGRPALITVIHVTQNERVYANITSIIPLPEGMKAPTSVISQPEDDGTSDEAKQTNPTTPPQSSALERVLKQIENLEEHDDKDEKPPSEDGDDEVLV
jgi:hypothetical protein